MNRASLMANIPLVLKHLTKETRAEAGGQVGLFGSASSDDLRLVELPEWSEDEKLWRERKALGTFVSGHPLDKLRAKIAKSATHKCRDQFDLMQSGGNVRLVVAGLVRSYERRGRIAFLTLEDETGALDAIMFNDEAERFAHCLMVNAILAVKLKPRHDNNRSSLQVLEVFRLGQFRAPQ